MQPGGVGLRGGGPMGGLGVGGGGRGGAPKGGPLEAVTSGSASRDGRGRGEPSVGLKRLAPDVLREGGDF